ERSFSCISPFIAGQQPVGNRNTLSSALFFIQCYMAKIHIGGTLGEDFLNEEGMFAETQARAVKKIFATELEAVRQKRQLSKQAPSTILHTSRSGVQRLLDPENTSVTLSSLSKAAAALNRRLVLSLGRKHAPKRRALPAKKPQHVTPSG